MASMFGQVKLTTLKIRMEARRRIKSGNSKVNSGKISIFTDVIETGTPWLTGHAKNDALIAAANDPAPEAPMVQTIKIGNAAITTPKLIAHSAAIADGTTRSRGLTTGSVAAIVTSDCS